MQGPFLQGQELGRLDFVHTVPLNATDNLRLGDDDDVFVCRVSPLMSALRTAASTWEAQALVQAQLRSSYSPRRRRIMPKMPAMLVTRLPASDGFCTMRTSPDGRSIISAGWSGDDGERKRYCDGDAWMLMSRNRFPAADMLVAGRRTSGIGRATVRRGGSGNGECGVLLFLLLLLLLLPEEWCWVVVLVELSG